MSINDEDDANDLFANGWLRVRKGALANIVIKSWGREDASTNCVELSTNGLWSKNQFIKIAKTNKIKTILTIKKTAGTKLIQLNLLKKTKKSKTYVVHKYMTTTIIKIIIMKSGKRHMMDGMELPNQEKIKTPGEKETYKYLRILETNTIKQLEMKERITKEYLRRN